MTPEDPKKSKSDPDEMREEALKRLRGRRPDVPGMSGKDLESLVHELEVRHVELEVQNEELRRAQSELQEVRDRYQELYEWAPVGYLTVDEQWKITRANLAAAKLCGLDSGDMVGRRIEKLVMPESRDACYKHLHNVAVTQSKQRCELRLRAPDDSEIWAQMETSPVGGTHEEGSDAYRVVITDVTDRKKAEEELGIQQERLRLAVRGGAIGLWESDLRTEKTTWSDTLYELLGRDRHPPITREDFFKFIHEEDRPRVHRHATQWFSSGGEFEDEFRVVRTDGQVRWFAAIGRLYRDEEGRPVRVAGVNYDITYRKMAEDALRQSERRYHQLFESMSEGFLLIEMIFDDAGEAVSYRFLEANPSLERLTPLKRRDIIGKDARDILPGLEPHWIETFARVASTGAPEHIERFSKDLGSWFDVYAYRPESGKVALIYTNTTESKRANEERDRLLTERTAVMESMSDGLVLADPEGRVIYHNPASLRLHGYSNLAEALIPMDEVATQWEIFDLMGNPVPIEDWPMSRALRGESFGNYELRVRSRRDKGRSFIGRYSGTLVSDSSGHPLCAMFLVHDITEELWAKDELEALNQSLEQRVAERTAQVGEQADRLRALAVQLSQTERRERMRLAQVLHDNLQQILVAARMQVEWLKHDSESERSQTAARAADALLREALEASRSLVTDLIPPVLHEAGLVGALSWLSSRMMERNQFAFTLRADNKAEPAVEDTRYLLFECARELLMNSMKHSGVNEAELVLTRNKDDRIRLTVSDEGKGFDPESVAKPGSANVSFGLFSIEQRLSHIGGEIEIITAPGEGTAVTLTVPTDEPAPSSPEIPKATRDQIGAKAMRLSGNRDVCRVLIVDDHKIMREGLVGLLQFESDMEVVGEAPDGPQAVELAEKLKPHVVIMDVNLGEMSGIEATRRILAKDPEIKVIGLSMRADKDTAAAMRGAGAIAYLPKSRLSEKDLIATVRACRKS
jgi:PAS domain S-box-containing protein